MMSSGQVAQMMSQQNQMFAGAAQYSHQISASMPNMYGGGAPGGGGFSYGAGAPMGYDFASRASGGVVSAMGGIAQFGLTAGSLMASMGMMGSAGRAVLDPFAGGGAMYRMGGRAGMGMMGRLGMGAIGMAPVMAGLGLASHAIGSVVGGAQEQAQVEQTLGRHQFINPATGARGFSRPQAMAIGDMMRKMEALPEMMTSMGELTRIMDKMGSMGLMQGAQNVADFGQKFKDTIKVLKDMSKVMGTTMEEALPMFGEIRRSGIYATSDILKNAMARQVTGGITGMNQGQVGALQQMGAQVGFAYGGSRAAGGRHALRVANQLGIAKSMGFLSGEQIMELTGLEGAAGIQAMAGQLTQTGYRMSRGALGTAMTLALGEQEDGRYTGQMDEDLMQRFRTGEISRSELIRMARRKTRGRGSKLSYVARRQQMRANMASAMGVEGQLQMLKGIMGGRGFTDPDELRIVAQRFGMSEREADLMVELAPKFEEMQISMGQRKGAEAKRLAQEAFMKENYSWGAIKTKVSKRISNIFTKPFRDFGVSLRNQVNETIDEFVDDITGRYKVEVTQGMSDLARAAMGDIGTSRARMGELLSGGAGRLAREGLGGGQNMAPGYLGAAVDWMTGRTTAGERLEQTAALFDVRVRERDVGTAGTGVRRGGRMVGGGRDVITSRTYGRGWTEWGGINQERYIARGDIERIRGTAAALTAGRDTTAMERLRVEAKGSPMVRADLERASIQLRSVLASRPDIDQLEGAEKLKAVTEAMDLQASRRGWQSQLVTRGRSGATRQEVLAMAARESGFGGFEEAYGAVAGQWSFTVAAQEKLGESIREQEQGLRETMGREEAERYMAFVRREGGGKMAEAVLATVTGGEDLIGVRREAEPEEMRGRAGVLAGGAVPGDRDYQMTVDKPATVAFLRDMAQNELAGRKISAEDRARINAQPGAFAMYKREAMFSNIMKKAQGDRDFNEAELEYMRESLGIEDPKDLTKELATTLREQQMLHQGGDPERMATYLNSKKGEGVIEMGLRMKSMGKRLQARGEELRGSGIKFGKDAEAALELITKVEGRLVGITDANIGEVYGLTRTAAGKWEDVGEGRSVQEDIGAAATAISKIKDETKREAVLWRAGTDITAAYGRYELIKGKSKKELERMFAPGQFLGKTVAERELGEKARGFLEEGGGGREALAQFIAGGQGMRTLTAAGVEQRSRYANQAEIAGHMAKFSENTASLASIVKAMGGGEQKGKGEPAPAGAGG